MTSSFNNRPTSTDDSDAITTTARKKENVREILILFFVFFSSQNGNCSQILIIKCVRCHTQRSVRIHVISAVFQANMCKHVVVTVFRVRRILHTCQGGRYTTTVAATHAPRNTATCLTAQQPRLHVGNGSPCPSYRIQKLETDLDSKIYNNSDVKVQI